MSDEQKKFTEYILRNISTSDVHLGDLRYTIPAKQSRNLLSKTARLDYDAIMKSRASGSISKKLGKSLFEVDTIVYITPPKRKMAAPSQIIQFPQRTKSSVVIDVNDVFDESKQEQVINEEDAILKDLQKSYEENTAPVVAKNDKEKNTP